MADDFYLFYLYRITVHPAAQLNLFSVKADKASLLRTTIVSQPEASAERKSKWVLANIQQIDEDGYYLRFGRAMSVTLPTLGQSGSFENRQDTIAPNTHAFVDLRFQVCAIAYRAIVAPSVRALGNSFATALTETDAAKGLNITFEVAPIKDPVSFLDKLRGAHRVTSLAVTTRRPNPWDAHEVFRGVAESLEDMGGNEAKITWKGSMPPTRLMESVVSEAAATGRDAVAKLKESADSKRAVRVVLNDEHISIGQRIDNILDSGKRVFSVARVIYENVKRGTGVQAQAKAVAEQEKVVVRVGRNRDDG